jgi:hypothetical protein
MPPAVFISYSHQHQDERWKDALVRQLGVLEREGLLATWHDGLIEPGADWLAAIETAMAEAQVAVFIVSAYFLNSEFVRNKEIPALLERRRGGRWSRRSRRSTHGRLASFKPPDDGLEYPCPQ